jgi:hypothetical protein
LREPCQTQVVIWFGALNHKEYKQRSIISEKVTEAGQTKLITVDVTYPNVRIKGDVVPGEHDTEPDIYVPRHSLIEVSSKHYVLYLNVIYPHIVEKVPEYFLSLQAAFRKRGTDSISRVYRAIIKNAHQQFIYNESILFSSGAS